MAQRVLGMLQSEMANKKNHLCGPAHPMWKGEAAGNDAKHKRAIRRFKLATCERCRKAPATDRHHKDGHAGNNDPSNIDRLCRRCHMDVDGRLSAFREMAASPAAHPVVPPKPCLICGRSSKPTRKGRCRACYNFRLRNGRDCTAADMRAGARTAEDCHQAKTDREREAKP